MAALPPLPLGSADAGVVEGPPKAPPTLRCPACGQPMRFEHHLDEQRLLPAGP